MNIVHLSSVKSEANGIGAVLSSLAKAQKELGHSVHVVTVTPHKQESGHIFELISQKKNFEHFIKQNRPDIVIFHSVYSYKFIAFVSIVKRYKIPYFIQLHGALSKQNVLKHRWRKKIANILFFHKFIKQARTIIYLNHGEYRNSIVKDINPRYIIIPNGCYLPMNISVSKQVRNQVELIYIGRIELFHKALDILLEALYILKIHNVTNFHFSFYGIGEGKDFQWFSNEIKKLSPVVEYKGPIYGLAKDKVYKESDILVLTSRSEGMPMAVLEAISYGIPCILTPRTNMSDVVVDYGAGWECQLTAQSIANVIQSAVNDYIQNPTSYKENAFHLAHQYDWKLIAAQSIELYMKEIMEDIVR